MTLRQKCPETTVASAGPRDLARLVMVLALILVMTSPNLRAEDWMPVVSTTAGDDVARQVARPAPLPQWADPRLLNATPAVTSPKLVIPSREAVSSNIVTGALPDRVSSEERPAVKTEGTDQVAVETPQPNAAKGSAGDGRGAKTRALSVPVAKSATQVASPAADVRSAAGSIPKSPGLAPAAAKPAVSVAPAAELAPATASNGESSGLRAKPMEALPPEATSAQQYCFNTAESASDARFAWQAKKIAELEAELEKRVQLLQAKTEEYKSWLARRDEFSRKAHEKLVGFYAKMKPDAAALQMTVMDEETAAALLTKLEPKVASLILAEIEPARAAKITTIISGAAKIPADKRQKGAAATPSSANSSAKLPAGTSVGSGAGTARAETGSRS